MKKTLSYSEGKNSDTTEQATLIRSLKKENKELKSITITLGTAIIQLYNFVRLTRKSEFTKLTKLEQEQMKHRALTPQHSSLGFDRSYSDGMYTMAEAIENRLLNAVNEVTKFMSINDEDENE